MTTAVRPVPSALREAPPDLAELARELLRALGEDPTREGLVKTPERMARALTELTAGYRQDPEQVLNGARFTERYDEMVLVKGIEFQSLCEHHLLPFFGTCHVAYLPDGRIVGLSKIPRVVDCFARRLQVHHDGQLPMRTMPVVNVPVLHVGIILIGGASVSKL